ncbi:hypothetical protein H072_7570 [Dactylellina haptotyla CBS 200.50]|uniref:Essential protein Yae1 N-terminal domain-containing protein n=1 Tax=Dactylellina haptotyla (strain CBS 200.50) TaxID=1284197 RepID=S8A7A5_DACHA|nr:hypothetical protein H072_7570 [Dactylellina haptotyla CBS 200.50]
MSSADTNTTTRLKPEKVVFTSLQTGRDSNAEYSLHCVPKAPKKPTQPKPPPKYTDGHKTTLVTPLTVPPQTPEKGSSRHFKQTLENYEKQLKLKTVPPREPKLKMVPKEATTKISQLMLTPKESERILALHEEGPARTKEHFEEMNFDQYDNSRANLMKLCKIAYEKGRKDGITEDQTKTREEGYCQGYKDGQKDGREDGWKEGYREGYDEGYMKGREYGDKKIEKEINETIAELTQNPSALLMTSKYQL